LQPSPLADATAAFANEAIAVKKVSRPRKRARPTKADRAAAAEKAGGPPTAAAP
jgi:hypothetical protein